MSLRGGLYTASDLLSKLCREKTLLDEQITSDRLFNFVVTAHSLNDWIKNDPNVTQSAKDALQSHRRNELLRVCRDVANACKHFNLDDSNERRSVTAAVVSRSGFGVGRFGVGGYGVGEESITVALRQGHQFDVLRFCREVVDVWSSFFERHGI